MKIIILSAGLLAGLAASGQQKDLFNAEEHLQKMKAKQQYTLIPELLQPSQKTTYATGVLPAQPNSSLLPNGDTLHYGNGTMPCVKPDLRTFRNTAYSESAGGYYGNNTMPNGALRKEP